MKIDKDIICKNNNTTNYNYRVGYQVITENKYALKKKTPFKGPYNLFQTLTNGSVTLRKVEVTTRVKISRINPYKRNKYVNVYNQYE